MSGSQSFARQSLGLARNLWKKLPLGSSLRGAVSPAFWSLYERYYWRDVTRPVPTHAKGPGPVNVAGYLSQTHGLAASANRCIATLKRLGVDVRTFDLSDAQPDVSGSTSKHEKYVPGPWIIHVNAPEFMLAHATIGKDLLSRSFVAGYWAWELPEAEPAWKDKTKFLSELWVPSHYTAKAFEDCQDLPVRVVPHIFETQRGVTPAAIRQALALGSDEFIAVALCDLRSSAARKNPQGAICAFKQAFGSDTSAKLILKIQNGDWALKIMAELQALADGSNIVLIDEKWPGDRVVDLIAAADVLISLHRAEGFGVTMAEAMALETPVIATGWSGNTDFMTDDTAILIPSRQIPVRDPQGVYSGQYWAEPDIGAASSALTKLRNDPDFARDLAKRA
ncbi:MAG: glycosyltransferase family 4 protein, partial [Pseudomonadota bacterium]